jgi:outer membrane lipoprotein-sorting protein
MNRRAFQLILTVLTALTLQAATARVEVPASGQESARDIVDRVDRLMRGESSVGTVTMEVVTEHWSRAMEMRIWSLGTDYALIRIASPRKDAGTATLRAGNDIWNYLPRVDRTIKIPTSLMGAAWMGSHFTNDDLVKESRMIEDYDIMIAFEGTREGVEVWEFELSPKPEAAVIWGRIRLEVRKDDLMPVWVRYYDEREDLVRTLTFGEYGQMGGRLVPALMEVVPEDKPGERTTVRYSDLEFDVGLDESFFSLRSLRTDPGR